MEKEHTITLSLFQLLAAKSAIKLEALGMRHSSGRSARKHWAQILGLPKTANCQQVVSEIEKVLASIPTHEKEVGEESEG